jgi:hypothetical protein
LRELMVLPSRPGGCASSAGTVVQEVGPAGIDVQE